MNNGITAVAPTIIETARMLSYESEETVARRLGMTLSEYNEWILSDFAKGESNVSYALERDLKRIETAYPYWRELLKDALPGYAYDEMIESYNNMANSNDMMSAMDQIYRELNIPIPKVENIPHEYQNEYIRPPKIKKGPDGWTIFKTIIAFIVLMLLCLACDFLNGILWIVQKWILDLINNLGRGAVLLYAICNIGTIIFWILALPIMFATKTVEICEAVQKSTRGIRYLIVGIPMMIGCILLEIMYIKTSVFNLPTLTMFVYYIALAVVGKTYNQK